MSSSCGSKTPLFAACDWLPPDVRGWTVADNQSQVEVLRPALDRFEADPATAGLRAALEKAWTTGASLAFGTQGELHRALLVRSNQSAERTADQDRLVAWLARAAARRPKPWADHLPGFVATVLAHRDSPYPNVTWDDTDLVTWASHHRPDAAGQGLSWLRTLMAGAQHLETTANDPVQTYGSVQAYWFLAVFAAAVHHDGRLTAPETAGAQNVLDLIRLGAALGQTSVRARYPSAVALLQTLVDRARLVATAASSNSPAVPPFVTAPAPRRM